MLLKRKVASEEVAQREIIRSNSFAILDPGQNIARPGNEELNALAPLWIALKHVRGSKEALISLSVDHFVSTIFIYIGSTLVLQGSTP